MSHGQMYVSDHNPNDVTGGGGCLCSPQKQTDGTGPYLVFPANDMENIASPHVVQCAPCVAAGFAAIHGEVLSAGEDMTPLVIEGTAEELPAPSFTRHGPADSDYVPEL